MILYVILIFIMLKPTRCSKVIDVLTQPAVYVSNYCPTMKYCKEGTHVMCMYYNHERTVGPLCSNYKKVQLNPDLVEQILQHVNEIRSKLAMGKETGKSGVTLPRAYGMMRMQWDSELATLAQVLANQCLGLREDECRATERFPSPSQIVTLINFKVPDWDYISHNITSRGLTKQKLTFAINKALNSLHAVKKSVSADSIYECPALDLVTNMGSRSYLKLIRGKATHIGCGMSAYMRYHAANNEAQNIYNSVQLVCNISDGPVSAQPLYTVEPPIPNMGFSKQCGCPPGSKETSGCLCEIDLSHVPLPEHKLAAKHGKVLEPEFHAERPGERAEDHHVHVPRRRGPLDVLHPREILYLGAQNVEHAVQDKKNDNIKLHSTYNSNSHEKCSHEKEEPKVVLLPIFQIQDAPLNPKEKQKVVEKYFHERYGNKSFFRTESMERIESSEERYKPYRRSYEDDHLESKPGFRDDMTAAHKFGNQYISGEDPLIDQYSGQNELDDKINEINDDIEDEKFVSILEMLEQIVQKMNMGDKQRKFFEFKMKKIYDSVQNPKTELKEKNSNQNTNLQILKPISVDKRTELNDEFLELTNYLSHKSRHKIPDETKYDVRSQNRIKSSKQPPIDNDVNQSNDDYVERKDSDNYEPDRDNSKNPYLRHLDHYSLEDKNVDTSRYIDHQHDENEEYPTSPPSRNQETLGQYNNKNTKGIKSAKRKQFKNLDDYKLKGFKTDHRDLDEYPEKGTDSEREITSVYDGKTIHKYNKNEEVKPHVRRPLKHTENGRRSLASHTPIYRRILDNKSKRPMLSSRDHAARHQTHIADRVMFA